MRVYPQDREVRVRTFGRYAQYYDTIYKAKDYRRECAYLEKLFRRHAGTKVRTILDLGCGTANHMIPFLERGYTVTGVDASAQMLKLAAQKLDESGLKAELHREKLQSLRLGRTFDAVVCLFSVIDYVTQKKDLLSALKKVAGHMKRSSVFIFDFWNESAVNGYYTPRKQNRFRADGRVIERRSVTKIFPSRNLCEVRYTCFFKRNGRRTENDRENHRLRYFKVAEMEGYLEAAGLKAVDVHPFLKEGGTIRKNTWDITMVARKR